MIGITLSHHRTFSKAFQALGAVALLLWQSPTLVGQSPVFVTSSDVTEAIVGVPFNLTFTLTNAEGQRFSPPSFQTFSSTGGVSELRGFTFEKGQSRTSQSWSYSLVPTQTGLFSIGAATVYVGGRGLKTPPFSIKVLSAPSSKGGVTVPAGDDQVFIASSLNKQKAFPGEQLVWNLKLYTRLAIEGADLISMPDFEGFYSKEKRHFNTQLQYQTIKGKKYAVKTLHEEAIFPQTSGNLTIGAAQIRVGIEQAGGQGFLIGPKPVTLTSQPINVTIMPLPEPHPDGFSGGVGHYSWEVRADSNYMTTDDALTLTVLLRGNGDSRRFAAPKIAVPATCEIFEPRIVEETEIENETEIVHKKKLEYVILAKEPGIHEIVPTLTYFDIDSNQYCTITAAPIRVEVVAGPNYKPVAAIDTMPLPLQTAIQVGMWEKAINIVGSPAFLWVLLLSFLIFAGVFFFRNRKARVVPQPQLSSTERASMAQRRFAKVGNLVQEEAPEIFYNELLKSLQQYIAVRLNLAPAQLTQAVLRSKLAERRVAPVRVQAFLSILQTCEAAVFSGHIDASKMESDWRTAELVLQELEKEIQG